MRGWGGVLALWLVACGGDGTQTPSGVEDTSTPALDTAPPEPRVPDPLSRRVTISSGEIKGTRDGDVFVYRGVPYASPPTGALRWQAPQPVESWDDTLDASAFGTDCVQIRSDGTPYGSEDCLTLNIWAPAAPTEYRPVLFYIHGGDNIIGSGSSDLYDGQYLVDRSEVVFITLNYRLGPFGFLTHESLEDASGSSGNYALQDLIAGLQWVQDNIEAFGGDPDRVMVFGQSAGADNTCALLASPEASGLFHRALMQSANCNPTAETIVAATSVAAVDALGCTDASDIAACMRSASTAEVATVPGASLYNLIPGIDFYYTIDGRVLPDNPRQAMFEGRHNAMPIVLGATEDEYTTTIDYMISPLPTTEVGYQAAVREFWSPEVGDWLLELYPSSDYPSYRFAMAAPINDYIYHCPTRRLHRALAASQSEPTYRYQWSYALDPTYGAGHASEVPYVHHTMLDPTAEQDALSNDLIDYWTSFAETGVPQGAQEWPVYDTATDRHLVLDVPFSVGEQIRTELCDVWDTTYGEVWE